ncbi:MAG: GtrA family protein [Anaerolineales bacterium]
MNQRRELTRFFKFSVVGTIGAVVDFGTFNLLRNVVGIPAAIAQAMSFSAAVISNFLWNRYWTYPDSRSKPVGRQASQFLIVSLVGLTIRTGVFVLVQPITIALVEALLPREASSSLALAVGENLALVVAVLVVLLWNFGVNRMWTYSDVQ